MAGDRARYRSWRASARGFKHRVKRVHHLSHDPYSLKPVVRRVQDLVHARPRPGVVGPTIEVAGWIKAKLWFSLRHCPNPIGKRRMDNEIAVHCPMARKPG